MLSWVVVVAGSASVLPVLRMAPPDPIIEEEDQVVSEREETEAAFPSADVEDDMETAPADEDYEQGGGELYPIVYLD